MKKILAMALALSLALVLCACSGTPKQDYSQYGTSAVIDIGDVSAKAGGTVDVPISIVNNPGVAAIGVELSFDTSMLTAVKAKAVGKIADTGYFLSNAGSGTKDETLENAGVDSGAILGSTGDNVKLLWFSAENMSGDGEIFVVTFQVAENASGNCVIKAVEKDDDLVSADGDNMTNISDKVYLEGSVNVG